jgi:hypothetical protein
MWNWNGTTVNLSRTIGNLIGSSNSRSEGKVLLICRRPEEVDTASRFSDASVTVACDSHTVRQRARDSTDVDAIEYIEKPENTFEYAEPVIEVIDTLNEWFGSLHDGEESAVGDALQWVYHPEGGVTAQKVLDVVFLVDSYLELFEHHQPDEVVYHDTSDYAWENEILSEAADSVGVPTTVVCSPKTTLLERIGLPTSRRRHWWTYLSESTLPAVATLRQAKLHWRILSTGDEGSTPAETSTDGRRRVSLFHRGDSEKHVDWTEALGEPFLASSQFETVITCWRDREPGAELSDAGFEVLNLEDEVDPAEWIRAVRELWLVLYRAVRHRDRLDGDDFSYRGVSLRPVIWPWIEYFLLSVLFNRVGYVLGAERHFESFDPDVVRLPGLGLYTGSGVALESTLERETDALSINSKPFPKHPIRPCRGERVPVNDIVLAAGELERERMTREGTPDSRIETVGAPHGRRIKAFDSDKTTAESEAALGIEDDNTLRIAYMPQHPIRGQITLLEHYEVARGIFEYVAGRGDVSLLVKPHPSDETSVIPSLYDETHADGIVVVGKDQLPYDCINVADILVTKWSTTGFEAMLMGVPVVTVSTADDKPRQMFGQGAVHCDSVDELSALLSELLSDSRRREEWFDRRLTAQRQFVDQNLNPDVDHAERTTQAVARRLDESG